MLTKTAQEVCGIPGPFVPSKPKSIQNIENIVQIRFTEPTAVEVVDLNRMRKPSDFAKCFTNMKLAILPSCKKPLGVGANRVHPMIHRL